MNTMLLPRMRRTARGTRFVLHLPYFVSRGPVYDGYRDTYSAPRWRLHILSLRFGRLNGEFYANTERGHV